MTMTMMMIMVMIKSTNSWNDAELPSICFKIKGLPDQAGQHNRPFCRANILFLKSNPLVTLWHPLVIPRSPTPSPPPLLPSIYGCIQWSTHHRYPTPNTGPTPATHVLQQQIFKLEIAKDED